MSAVSRIVAVALFVAVVVALHAAPRARAHHYAPADEVRSLLVDAYVFGGWSRRDAESIADIKVERMTNHQFDGEIPDFVPHDPRGRLSESSSGVAVIANMLTDEFGWDFFESMQSAWQMYSDLSGWAGANRQTPGRIGCRAYSIRYEYCRDGQLFEVQVFWNSPCTATNFRNKDCVAHTFDCECPSDTSPPECICGAEFTPSGPCHGVPSGGCVRFTQIQFLPSSIPCNVIIGDSKGGCKDCSPPQSFEEDCVKPVVAACVRAASCPCTAGTEACEESEDEE